MRISAGAPHPLGATWDGRGTNFALFSANAEKVELCLFDSQGRREIERIALPERTEDVWHGYLNDVVPGQLYGYRVHGPYEPERGLRFNSHKLLHRSLCQAARRPARLERRPFRLSRRQRARRSLVRPARQRARHAEERGGRRSLHLGRGTQALDPVGRHDHLRSPRQRPDAASRGCAAGLARHVSRLDGARRRRSSQAAWRHHDRAAADPRLRRRPAPDRARPEQLLGLQHDRLLRARGALRRRRAARRISLDGVAPARRRHRGHPRRRLQPHRRRQSPRSDPELPRHRQHVVLLAAAGSAALLRRLHRLRQRAQSHPSARAADGDGFAALLGRGLPRRRIPLRSRHHARPRSERLRSRRGASSRPSGRIRCWRASS